MSDNRFQGLAEPEDKDKMADDIKFFVSSATIPATAKWASTLLGDITAAFDRVSAKIASSLTSISTDIEDAKQEVLRSVSEAALTATAAKTQADQNTLDIANLKTEMLSLQRDNVILKAENNILKTKSESHEMYSRRDNLVATGIPDINNETDMQCRGALHLFFENQLGMEKQDAKNIKFVRCHRLGNYENGRSRPIIMRFFNYDDRQRV